MECPNCKINLNITSVGLLLDSDTKLINDFISLSEDKKKNLS